MTIFQDKAQPGTGTSSGAEARPLIQKVPRILRENEKNKSNYDPKLVSIGPYHYGNSRLELGHTLKTKLVQQFVSHVNTKTKNLQIYFQSEDFNKVAREARYYYANDATKSLDEKAFKCLMFLDGCFVNQTPYILLQALAKEFIPTKPGNDGTDHENDDIETFTKWLNMAAYEACADFLNDRVITSFLCFMDSLIDSFADVKGLLQQGILQNFLGSDQHVADLFNELATDLTPNPDEVIWITEAVHTHFSAPWTLLAFLAAILVLILTGIQTILTGNQTYLAANLPPH
ncbi:hypothetical protein NE237_005334 [Protea cynaroides]|uniref:Uncharacterized protein n=1 Tax=Protea cynaroides TaxID=273540 RepID=A0A9Q0QU68_9MAGN|nr:hypothetical protein NE237_005334 [Protea cynaroides]